MRNTEGLQSDVVPHPTDDLAGWDWLAELRRQERSIPWLARHTDRSQHSVYQYANGNRPTPREWLKVAAIVLGKGV
jgi:hypothetical protein